MTAATRLSETATPGFSTEDASHPTNIFHSLLGQYIKGELAKNPSLPTEAERAKAWQDIELSVLQKLRLKLLERLEYLKNQEKP